MRNLGKDDARKVISAILHLIGLKAKDEVPTREHYADVHSLAAQRLFNVMCLAYGSDQELFADLVDKGQLPRQRGEDCWAEYAQVAHAFVTLIRPHIDPSRCKDALAQKLFTAPGTRPTAVRSDQGHAK